MPAASAAAMIRRGPFSIWVVRSTNAVFTDCSVAYLSEIVP
jgi:hypothetical protein